MENTLLTCEGLHRRGHQVLLITGPALGPEGELMSRARAGGYQVAELPDLRREINPPRDWRGYRAIAAALVEFRPDIVHTHTSKAGILGRQAAYALRRRRTEFRGCRIVHTIHGLPFHPFGGRVPNWFYIRLERHGAAQSDAIISVADAMTQQALAAGVGRPEQYTTIYSGMEIDVYRRRPEGVAEFRAALGLSEADVLVTQVARLFELKGHEYLIAAAGQLPPNIHFCFVGDGTLRGQLEQAIRAAALTPRFHLTGLLPPERVPLVIHASDILAHVSLREGLARALPQGMLAGKPVVSWDVDGAREVVNADTGMLLPTGDVAALASALLALAQSPSLRAKLGSAGLALAESRFDHEVMVDQIERLYERLLPTQ